MGGMDREEPSELLVTGILLRTRLKLVQVGSACGKSRTRFIQWIFPRSVKGKAKHVQGRHHSFFLTTTVGTKIMSSSLMATTSWPSSCIERRLGRSKGRTLFSNSGCGKRTSFSRMRGLSSMSSFRIEYPQLAWKLEIGNIILKKNRGSKKKKTLYNVVRSRHQLTLSRFCSVTAASIVLTLCSQETH